MFHNEQRYGMVSVIPCSQGFTMKSLRLLFIPALVCL